jgi:hypothetical protein
LDAGALQSLAKNGLPSVDSADVSVAVDEVSFETPATKEVVDPLRTLTRRASRIIQQRSTPHLSLTKVNQEAEAFQLERLERIRLKRLSEEASGADDARDEQRDVAKTLTKALSCGSLLKALPKPRQDYILLASGRRQKPRIRKVSSGRLLSTPPSSPTILEEESKVYAGSAPHVQNNLPPQVSSWGEDPLPWVTPSLYTSTNSSMKETTSSGPINQEQKSPLGSPHIFFNPPHSSPLEAAGSPHTSYTTNPPSSSPTIFCASSSSLTPPSLPKSAFRMKIEVRKGHFEVLEILEVLQCAIHLFALV